MVDALRRKVEVNEPATLVKTAAPAPSAKPGYLWKGPGTYEIPVELFANNRNRLIERLRAKVHVRAVVLLQGGDEVPLYDTDTTFAPFRQESFFMWAFGVDEPGCYGAIDLQTKTNCLFIPRPLKNYRIRQGPLHLPQDFVQKYAVHEVHYNDELVPVLEKMAPTVLLTLRGVNVDSNLKSHEARFPGMDKFQVDTTELLYNEMADLRVYKSDHEIDVLKYVAEVTVGGHKRVMRFARPGKTEYQCEAEFLRYCYAEGGCRTPALTCICASGPNASYPNYKQTEPKIIEPGNLCLLEMGASYFGYCSKITSTVPASGKFSAQQKSVYEAVLTTFNTIFKQLKPGVTWTDVHLLSQRTLLAELKKAGLLKGETDQMVAAGLGLIFHPHAVGNLLGLDVHDVGGFIGAKRSDNRTATTLRTTRTLEERMVLTLGPGCYFNDVLMEQALANDSMNRYLVAIALKKFRGMGGVKIEDNVLITKNGAVSLTKMPKTVQEVEECLSGKERGKQ